VHVRQLGDEALVLIVGILQLALVRRVLLEDPLRDYLVDLV